MWLASRTGVCVTVAKTVVRGLTTRTWAVLVGTRLVTLTTSLV
jgi:hypothetical protein